MASNASAWASLGPTGFTLPIQPGRLHLTCSTGLDLMCAMALHSACGWSGHAAASFCFGGQHLDKGNSAVPTAEPQGMVQLLLREFCGLSPQEALQLSFVLVACCFGKQAVSQLVLTTSSSANWGVWYPAAFSPLLLSLSGTEGTVLQLFSCPLLGDF